VASEALAINAPIAGQVVPLAAVPDPVFSSGAMGNGLAVLPTEGTVYAPITGVLTAQMPHAYGITADNGVEVLIHVGIDTVNLHGQHFTPKTTKGQRVNAGQVLAEFDLDAIKAAGYNPMTIMVITNTGDYTAVIPIAEGQITPRELALDIVT
jgi:PTS system beta-glucosides-specific IIC component